jgi:predicted alpha/beta hydrolase
MFGDGEEGAQGQAVAGVVKSFGGRFVGLGPEGEDPGLVDAVVEVGEEAVGHGEARKRECVDLWMCGVVVEVEVEGKKEGVWMEKIEWKFRSNA